MRFAFLRFPAGLALLFGLCGASGAAPRNAYVIDFEASAPTLGDLLDREEKARREAREKERRLAPVPEKPRAETTGSITPHYVSEPRVPRNAVTVILPHPGHRSGRPEPRGILPR